MTGFASLIDQENSIRILTAILQKRTIPHALLFTGIDGVGKRSAAMAFAMALNCVAHRHNSGRQSNAALLTSGLKENHASMVEPCGDCSSCRKIASNNHPDYIHIRPVGPIIRIGQIRELLQTLTMRPYEAEFRTVVISDAHRMNPEAGNALLKVLEEPPFHTTIILTATGNSDLLPTIVSRCQHIRFNPLSVTSLATVLMEKYNIGKDRAVALSGLSDGGTEKAKQLHRERWIEKRDWILAEGGFFANPNPGSFFALAQQLSLKKEETLIALSILKMLYRDLLVCRYQSDQLINSDVMEIIIKASGKETEGNVLYKIAAIDAAEKNIEENANSRLTLEALFLTLAKKKGMN